MKTFYASKDDECVEVEATNWFVACEMVRKWDQGWNWEVNAYPPPGWARPAERGLMNLNSYETDGVPAPSDIELAIADERNARKLRRDDLLEACDKFSAAHFYCREPDCIDVHCDPEDWAEFDAAIARVRGEEIPTDGTTPGSVMNAEPVSQIADSKDAAGV